MSLRTLLSLGLSAMLLLPASSPLLAGEAAPDPVPADKKTKEEKFAEKEKKTEEKAAANYEKIKEFSLNKYKTDPEFRDSVDAAFEETMRKHSQEAFEKNINRRSTLVSVSEDTWRRHFSLYDNLMVQDHINRIGQRLVPLDSEKLFAFRVIPDPTPMAKTLSTGTIYVSTGLISMLDSEAQLAYVLAHEMAHVHLDHWREFEMINQGVREYNKSQELKVARVAGIASIAGAALGGGIGKSAAAAVEGAMIGAGSGFLIGWLMNRPVGHTEWDRVQEDQADEMAFKAVLNATYDVREVPKVYLAIEKAAAKDARIQLGFIGQRRRLKQRTEKAEDLIKNSMKAEIELKGRNGFLSSSAEHRNLMAELKRDNGILAFYHDMFEMARTNLQEAVAIRDNDPAAHYFYAKTLKLVGRSDDDMRIAKESFFKAAKADNRQQNYGSHLHLALMMARENGVDTKQVANEMDTYVTGYARWSAEHRAMTAYPPNLDSIYEYISLYGGDPNWKPRVPDLRELDHYRAIAEYGSPVREDPSLLPAAVANQQADPPAEAPPVNRVKPAAAGAAGLQQVLQQKKKK